MTAPGRNIPVLFENEHCMVFNKPSGLPVQGGEGVKTSLDSILSASYEPRPFLVHRLDKDTSGLILVAKTKEAAAAFSALLSEDRTSRDKMIVKKYLAAVEGVPDPHSGVISLPLEIKGRTFSSETRYQVASTFDVCGIRCCFLELELSTGRMHQIRRHLQAIGHPILGDDKYGNFKLNRELKKSIKLKRLMLHSWKLVIMPFPPFLPKGLDLVVPMGTQTPFDTLDTGV